jgi:predicted nucleic acid-binding protein
LSIYPDTSFLMSVYIVDRHSAIAHPRMAMRPSVFVTPFHRAELANAMYQQVFRGQILLIQANLAHANFERHCRSGSWAVTDWPDSVFATAVRLARRHGPTLGVRTLDTLHVAAALELKASRFWTFDDRQATLAEAEGLTTA